MLLYFRSADLSYQQAAALCRALRRQGTLLCCPGDALEPDALAPLPFTAALLHFDRSPDGLPAPDALRAFFPDLPLIAVSETEPNTGRWRLLPGSDYELTGGGEPNEIAALLVHLRAAQNRRPAARCGLFLPDDRRRAMLLAHPIQFTQNEYILLRVLAETGKLLSPSQLASFLSRPGEPFPAASVPVHICRINAKAKARGIQGPVSCHRFRGYALHPPYNERLPEDRVTYKGPGSWGN